MPRRLPWSDHDSPARTPVKPSAATTSHQIATPQRATLSARTTPKPRESSNRHSARSNGFLRDRSPSTSPPPQPLPETFMVQGLENDDKYRMVEDELFTIAGQFTAHLHAAEYQRLKAHTKSQNAEAIRNISRPVVGSLTDLARKRQEEVLRKKKQREAIRQAKKKAGNDDDDESGDETGMPWKGTSLQGLMESPRKKEVPLMALTRADSGIKSSVLFGGVVRPTKKRPAAVLRQEEDEETEDESDDLGGVVRGPGKAGKAGKAPAARPFSSARPIVAAVQRPASAGTRGPTTSGKPAPQPRAPPTATTENKVSSPSNSAQITAGVANSNDEDDDDEEDLFTRYKNRKANGRDRRRPPAKRPEKSEGQALGDIIPSFL